MYLIKIYLKILGRSVNLLPAEPPEIICSPKKRYIIAFLIVFDRLPHSPHNELHAALLNIVDE